MKKNEEVRFECYENGNKKIEQHFKDGKLHGVTTAWFENGTKECEIHYKDGKPIKEVA